MNWTTIFVFVAGQIVASIVGGVALYVAIRSDLTRVQANIEHLKDFDTLILERADDAHARIDSLYAKLQRKSTA